MADKEQDGAFIKTSAFLLYYFADWVHTLALFYVVLAHHDATSKPVDLFPGYGYVIAAFDIILVLGITAASIIPCILVYEFKENTLAMPLFSLMNLSGLLQAILYGILASRGSVGFGFVTLLLLLRYVTVSGYSLRQVISVKSGGHKYEPVDTNDSP